MSIYTNIYQKKPVKFILYDPIFNVIKKIYMCLYNPPTNILSILKKSNISDIDAKILKDYYGADWRKLLIPTNVIGGNDDHLLDVLGIKIDKTDDAYDDDLSKNIVYKLEDDPDIFEPIPEELADKEIESIKYDEDLAIEYVNMSIFPYDTLYNIKEKISLVTDISILDQHIFYFTNNAIQNTYKIYNDVIVNNVDIRLYRDNYAIQICNINIDKKYEANKNNLIIVNYEQFTLMSDGVNYIDEIYIVDINHLIHQSSGLSNILDDPYQFDLFYYGFVLKYWPQYSKNNLTTLITSLNSSKEDEFSISLVDNYDISLTDDLFYNIKNKIALETSLISEVYDNAIPILTKYEQQIENICITSAKIKISTTVPFMLDITHVFNKFKTSTHVPIVIAYINTSRYTMLMKKHISIQNKYRDSYNYDNIIKNISRSLAKNTIAFIVNIDRIYIVVLETTGIYWVESNWIDTDKINFKLIKLIISENINFIVENINDINKNNINKHNKLPTIGSTDILHSFKIYSLTLYTYWPYMLSTNEFKQLKQILKKYHDANIITLNESKEHGIISFYFKKGIIDYDPSSFIRAINNMQEYSLIEKNDFMYMFNTQLYEKWCSIYSGRLIKLYFRTSNIKIEINKVNNVEFNQIIVYVFNFLDSIIKNDENVHMYKKASNNLKSLQENDPVLFNLHSYDKSLKVYSILCQHPRPPVMYYKTEVTKLPKDTQSRLIKYWNFTLEDEIYYDCPNKEYPYLSFLNDKHPLGYCLPCCQKTQNSPLSKKGIINNMCLTNYKIDSSNIEHTTNIKHILNYGKESLPGRLSSLPHILTYNIFNKDDSNIEYCLYSVKSKIDSIGSLPIYYNLAFIVDKDITQFAIELLNTLKTIGDKYYLIGKGVGNKFKDNREFYVYLHKILLVTEQNLYNILTKDQLTDIITELFNYCYDIGVIIIEDNNDEITIDYINTPNQYDNTTILLKNSSNVYPIILLNKKKNQIIQRTYNKHETIMSRLSDIHKTIKTNRIDYVFISNFALKNNYVIKKKLIGLRNLCYAVLIKNIYIPIYYSNVENDNIPLQYTILNETIATKTETMAMVDVLNIELDKLNMHHIIVNKHIHYNKKSIGFIDKHYKMYFYYKPETITEKNFIIFPYNISEINSLILENNINTVKKDNILIQEYRNTIFSKFLTAFVNHISIQKNTSKRKEIKKLIDASNFGDIINILNSIDVSGLDIKILNDMIKDLSYNNQLTKEKFISHFDKTQFNFDYKLYNDMMIMQYNDLYKKLDVIMKSKVTIVDCYDISCIKKNIAISNSDYNDYLCLLITYIQKYTIDILILHTIYRKYLNFDKYPTEEIIVII